PAKLVGRLLLAPRLQAAQDEGLAVLLGQAVQLLIEHGLQLPPGEVRGGRTRGLSGSLGLVAAAAGPGPPRLHGDAVSDPVQPAGDGTFLDDGAGLAGQDEERGLEGVLGVLFLAQETAADAHHQRAVALHEGREGGILTQGGEPAQRLAIAQLAGGLGVNPLAQVLQQRTHWLAGHRLAWGWVLWRIVPGGRAVGLRISKKMAKVEKIWRRR